jgi:NADH dehydrogenase
MKMVTKRTVAVTGAFSYSGQYIARAFLQRGWDVITLTRDPGRPHALLGKVKAFPLDFNNPVEIENNLRGVDTLVNTYWIRFEYPRSTFAGAVENSGRLIRAAEQAGVRRFVHLSVSKPEGATEPYFRGKLQVEKLLAASKLSYAILRPTIIFGNEEVLLNNITWLLRHFPIFTIPGNGKYRVQPVAVTDLADLAVRAAEGRQNQMIDTVGPEIYTFNEMLGFLKQVSRSRAILLNLPAGLALLLSRIVSALLGDVTLTREEMTALMDERLVTDSPPNAPTLFSDWARANAHILGKRYVNELKRHHGKGGRG